MEILEHLVLVGQRASEDCRASTVPQVTEAHRGWEFLAEQAPKDPLESRVFRVLEVSLDCQGLQGPQGMMELQGGMESQVCQAPQVTRLHFLSWETSVSCLRTSVATATPVSPG